MGEFFNGVAGSGKGRRGICVEIGEREAGVDVTMTVPYGRSILEVEGSMRDATVRRVENMTGPWMTEANTTVKDVSLPQQ